MNNVLLITNKEDVTTDFVVKRLKEQHVSFYRLNTEDISRSVSVTLDFKTKRYEIYDGILKVQHDLNDFQSVYFRRPKLTEYGDSDLTEGEQEFLKRENSYLLEGIYEILEKAYWLNKVRYIRRAENKIYQQILAREIGFRIPDGIITNEYNDFCRFAAGRETIIKPIKSGQIDDKETPKIVYTSKLKCIPGKNEVEYGVNYLQENIRKKYDIRVTIVGNVVYATRIDAQGSNVTETDWRRGEIVLPHSRIELPRDILDKCLEMMRRLELNYGAIDLIEDKYGEYVFLEINPNGQWAWIEKQAGYDISGEIVKHLAYGKVV